MTANPAIMQFNLSPEFHIPDDYAKTAKQCMQITLKRKDYVVQAFH